ncbi:MAG: TIGR00730 family Rossman fold protein [Bacteroidota bacterium]
MSIKSVAVFCGSQTGANNLYAQHAATLGRGLAAHSIELVYGGGNKGLMGALANATMQYGGKVIGVIPEILLAWEAQHDGITELRVVGDMHVRKKLIYELCDAAVILPGGNGTLDELFEMLTWNTLNIHNKKIILLNTAGYYDHLIQHIITMTEGGFLYEDWQERLLVCADPEEAISLLVSGTFQSRP